ncbi:MAG TPA: hypothetical protein PKG80_10395, partial [Acidobacteriota bacterium]|nr:hypothetical protein [Acidobacteriota bacterium]
MGRAIQDLSSAAWTLLGVRRAARVLAVGLACAAGWAAPTFAGLPFRVVHETVVSIETRLDLLGDPHGATVAERLEGPAGSTISASKVVPTSGTPLRVFLALTPVPDVGRAECRVRVVATITSDSKTALFDRSVVVRPDRLKVFELWGDAAGRRRLVLGLSASWTDRPRVVPIVAGSEPVEFAVRTLIVRGAARQQIEERRLPGLVGTPVKMSMRREPGAAVTRAGAAAGKDEAKAKAGPEEPADETPIEVELELAPLRISEGTLEVSAKLTTKSAAAPRAAIKEVRVASGESFDVEVDAGDAGEKLVFHVSCFF